MATVIDVSLSLDDEGNPVALVTLGVNNVDETLVKQLFAALTTDKEFTLTPE